MEWFKPRSSSTARTVVNGSGAGTGNDASPAKSAAKSAAATAAVSAVKVAAPEVAVPVAAAVKAAGVAGTAGHVLKSAKNTPDSASPAAQGAGGEASPAPLRQPRPDTAGGAAPAREPAQAPTLASRSTAQTPGRPADAGSQPPRGNGAPAGTIDIDERRQNDTAAPRAARPPRPPREIGP
jgi:hypothetical protein